MRTGAKTITKDYEIQSFVLDIDSDFFQLSFILNKKFSDMDKTKQLEYFDDLVENIRESLTQEKIAPEYGS